MDCEIFNKLSDDEFRVKAFAEYCQRAQERFSTLVNAMSNIDSAYEDLEEPPTTAQQMDTLVTDFMNQYGLGDSVVSLEEGYISTKQLLTECIRSAIDEDFEVYSAKEYGVYAENIGLDLTDATGTNSHPVLLSLANIGDQIQSQYHSITCLAAGATAYFESIEGNVADAITIFNDKVRDVFKDANADISSTTQYVKSLLSEADASVFVKGCIDKIGISKQAAATAQEDILPADNDMSLYTGSSPAGPLNFSSSLKAVTTIAKTAATVVAGVAKGIASLAGSLFRKVASKLNETLINPNDLELINDKGFNTVNGFQYQTKFGFDFSDEEFTADIVDQYTDKWIAMKTRFGEWCFKVNSRVNQFVNLTTVYKPRVINFETMNSVLLDPANHPTVTYQDACDVLDNLNALGSQLYSLTGLSERDAYRGLILSIEMDYVFHRIAIAQMRGGARSDEIPASFWLHKVDGYGNIPSTVTNLDWIKAFSGYENTLTDGTFNFYAPYRLKFSSGVPIAAADQTKAFMMVMQYEKDYPAAESPFVPFSNNHTSFNAPSFRIRTDAENKDAFNKFVTTAIIVAVVAAVAVGALVAIKKIARAKYFKRAKTVGEMDAKLWDPNQPGLTAAQQKQYVKATKRMNRSNVFSSGLSNPVSPQDNFSTSDYTEKVISYIVPLD